MMKTKTDLLKLNQKGIERNKLRCILRSIFIAFLLVIGLGLVSKSYAQVGGKVLEFDFPNDKVNYGSNTDFRYSESTSFTVEVWVKTTATGTIYPFWRLDDGARKGWQCFLSGGGRPAINLSYRNYSPPYKLVVYANTTVNDGEWHHVAWTYTASNCATISKVEFYIDGMLQTNKVIQRNTLNCRDFYNPTGQAATHYMGGQIDDLRVWNTVVSGSTLAAWKDQSITASHPNWGSMAAYYTFDEGTTGATSGPVPDSYGNKNGYNYGAEWIDEGGGGGGPGGNNPPDCSGAAIADQCAVNGVAVISGADVTGIIDPDNDPLTITVNPTTLNPGTTLVTVNADDGNGGTCTIDINVTVSQANANAGDDATIYIGYPPLEAILNATGGVLYSWSPSAGLSDPNVADPIADPGETTTYTVTVADAFGCEDTDEVVVEVMDVRCGKKNNKVLVCHVPPGNPGNAHTICVSYNAVAAHLAHGDYLGECTNSTSKPTTEPAPENLQVTVAPNPFNDQTNITIQLHDDVNIEMTVYNMTGMKIRTLKNGMISAGSHTINWNGQSDDGNAVRAGLYILRVTAGDESSHKKLMKN